MAEYHFTGYAACVDPYYFSKDHPIDVTVYADGYPDALSKAEVLSGCAFHQRTLRYTVRETLSCPNCGAKMDEKETEE